jgi:hypothetical protein
MTTADQLFIQAMEAQIRKDKSNEQGVPLDWMEVEPEPRINERKPKPRLSHDRPVVHRTWHGKGVVGRLIKRRRTSK